MFAKTRGRRCRNRRYVTPCEHHRGIQAHADEQKWWTKRLLNSQKPGPRRLGEELRKARRPVLAKPDAKALDVVEIEWEPGVAVTAPGERAVRLVSAEVEARLGSEEEDDPCGALDWLARLFLFAGLDFGVISFGLAEFDFIGLPDSGVAGEAWSELQVRLAEDGVELSREELAVQLRLLGIHACEKRRRVEACICLAELTAEELHTQITLRLRGDGRRGPSPR